MSYGLDLRLGLCPSRMYECAAGAAQGRQEVGARARYRATRKNMRPRAGAGGAIDWLGPLSFAVPSLRWPWS